MPMAGFQPAIPTSVRSQRYAYGRAATYNSNHRVQFKEQKNIKSTRTGVHTNTQLINLPEAATTSPGLASAVSQHVRGYRSNAKLGQGTAEPPSTTTNRRVPKLRKIV
jgi:hypothetical protein